MTSTDIEYPNLEWDIELLQLLLSAIAVDKTESVRDRIEAVSFLSLLNGWHEPQPSDLEVWPSLPARILERLKRSLEGLQAD